MNKLFLIIIMSAQIIIAQSNKHKLFSEILNDFTVKGYLNYEQMRHDSRLNEYLTQIEITNPDTISNKNDNLAFWINAYNAFTLKLIVENYPVESINDLHTGGLIIGQILGKTVWHKEWINIGNKTLSLNNIEHDIIRKEFSEPRIHFALVCAAVSCPPLRNEAYEGYKLNEQLNEQAEIFFRDESKNKFDVQNKTAELSKIIDWYDSDFGKNKVEILRYITKFLDEEISQNILNNLSDWDIDYLDYNWELNDSQFIK